MIDDHDHEKLKVTTVTTISSSSMQISQVSFSNCLNSQFQDDRFFPLISHLLSTLKEDFEVEK